MLKNDRDRTSLDPHPPVDVPQPSFASPRSKELKLVEEGTTIPEADVMSLNQQPLEKGEIDTEIMNPQIKNNQTTIFGLPMESKINIIKFLELKDIARFDSVLLLCLHLIN